MAELLGTNGQPIAEVQVRQFAGAFSAPINTYPSLPSGAGALPVSGGQTGAAAALTAQLTGQANKTTQIQGFHIAGFGATAGSIISVVISGLLNGSQTWFFAVPTGAAVQAFNLDVEFPTPIPALAVFTNIVVSVPSFGVGNLFASVSAHGYNF